MRAVVQRVSQASVSVAGEVVGAISGPGLLAFIGVTHDDDAAAATYIARKIAELRIFDGELSAVELAAPVLVVSQFTLYGSTKKGRRPSWAAAAPGDVAEPLVAAVAELLRERGLNVATGQFGAHMQVELVNDGPVTILLDTAM